MWFILILVILSLIYYLGQKNFGYWKKRRVPGPKPTWFVGNVGPSVIGWKSPTEIYADIYRAYQGHSCVGIYRVGTPCLLIRDLNFLRNMMIKDFKHFQNNDIELDKDLDRIMARNPFVLKGNEWKQKRQALTSCFTSGKIKGMFPLIENVSEKLIKYIEQRPSPLEIGEVCLRFTLDNVAACAFGQDGKCFEQENPEFRQIASRFFAPGPWSSFVTLILLMFPSLTSILKISFIPKATETRLIEIVASILKYRKSNNIKSNDFLEYVSELREKSDFFPDEIDIVAQAATFFGDGTETSSRVMRFALFELASNPDIQAKLREEINTICAKHGNRITYEAIMEMEYLDACVNETMRKNPVLGLLMKLCTEDYTYTPTDPEYIQTTVKVDAGTSIIIPLAGLHTDPKYFENPNKFMPERFLDKEKIIKFSFLPFGEGPRMCLGMRFGITQIKLGIAQVVRNFKMTVNKKTQLPLKFDNFFLLLEAIGGLWIDLEKISY